MISLIIALLVLGLVLYVVNLLPIDGTIKQIIQAVAIVAIVIWVIQTFMGGRGVLLA